MDILFAIALILMLYFLSEIKKGIINIQNTLFHMDVKLENIEEKVNPPSYNPYETNDNES